MKRIILALCAFFVFAGAQAQTEDEIKKWMDYMTPGDIHKMIASWDGDWTADIITWMAADAPPSNSTGSCTNKMILGGRYQQGTFDGSFSGMPFQGMSLLAYDNNKKIFESIWLDNMGTGVMHLKGNWDNAAKTLILTGPMQDPVSGKDITMRETLQIVDANTQIMSMYAPGPDGKEFKNMQITFKRKK